MTFGTLCEIALFDEQRESLAAETKTIADVTQLVHPIDTFLSGSLPFLADKSSE